MLTSPHEGGYTANIVLENTLIKKHKPKYNINLKNRKTYPVLKLTNEEFSFKLVVGENTLGLELLSVLHSLIKKDKINNLRFNESKRYNSD